MTLNVATTTVTPKQLAIARQIAEELTLRTAALSLVVASGSDASGFATITLSDGSAATGEGTNAFIRVTSVGTFAKDSLGLNQNVYTPNVIQIALEATSTTIVGTSLTVANINTLMTVLPACLKYGTRVELYLIANGTVPAVGAITGTPAAVYDDLYQPLTSSM